jgi:hypothetical protein
MHFFHDWRSVSKLGSVPDLYVCTQCGYEGYGWYDMLSGGVSVNKKRIPYTDLRLQDKIYDNPFI